MIFTIVNSIDFTFKKKKKKKEKKEDDHLAHYDSSGGEGSKMQECMPNLTFVDAVSKTAVIMLHFKNHIERGNRMFSLKRYIYVTKFHLIHLKSVQENESNRVCLALTSCSPAKVKDAEGM